MGPWTIPRAWWRPNTWALSTPRPMRFGPPGGPGSPKLQAFLTLSSPGSNAGASFFPGAEPAGGLSPAMLFFAGNSVSIPVHLDPGTVPEVVSGFGAGFHFRAAGFTRATEFLRVVRFHALAFLHPEQSQSDQGGQDQGFHISPRHGNPWNRPSIPLRTIQGPEKKV